MRVSDIQIRPIAPGRVEYSALISPETARSGDLRLWIRIPEDFAPAAPNGDSFLAALLIPCMNAREHLHIEAPVSQKLMESVPGIQALLRSWYADDLGEIQVTNAGTHELLSASHIAPEVSVFASGGVDSWYTLLSHMDEIQNFILIHGFDIRRGEKETWQAALSAIKAIASELDKRLLIVETNIKRACDPRTASWGRPFPGRFWRECYQGSALAAIILSMQERLGRHYLPASIRHDWLFPFGSHPDLDPLFSTENTRIIHHGCEHSRLGKIRSRIMHSPLALRNLRVCLQNLPNQLNCGRCEKCIRTLIGLRICGVLDQAGNFPQSLDLKRIRQLHIPKDVHIPIYEDLMNQAHEAGDKELADAIAVALARRFSLDHYIGIVKRQGAKMIMNHAPHRLRIMMDKKISYLLD